MCTRRDVDRRQIPQPALRLRDDLLGDDNDIAFLQLGSATQRQGSQIVAFLDLRKSLDALQLDRHAVFRSCSQVAKSSGSSRSRARHGS